MTFEFKVKDQDLISDSKKKIKDLSKFCKSKNIIKQKDFDHIIKYVLNEFHRKCYFSILYPNGYNGTNNIPQDATIIVTVMPAVKSFKINFDTGNTVPTILWFSFAQHAIFLKRNEKFVPPLFFYWYYLISSLFV